MRSLERGIATAFTEIGAAITIGMAPGIIINSLRDTLPLWFVLLFPVFAVAVDILDVRRMMRWKSLFTVGWVIGAIILLDAGLLGLWQFILWILCPCFVLAWRASKATE